MQDIETVVTAHLDAWNSPAGPERTASIGSVYAADVFVGEPQAALRGREGVEQAITALQAQAPGTRITRSGPIEQVQDLVTYTWSLGPSDGAALATGRDVLILGDAGVTSLYVLIDTP